MTKYNIGDKAELPIASGVVTATAGSGTCTPSSSKYCCWKGTTSTGCNTGNTGYSGCTRTVCDYNAANESCSKLTYNNRTWRVPDYYKDVKPLMEQLNLTSPNKGVTDLLLCDANTIEGATYCPYTRTCLGARDNYCWAYAVWSAINNSGTYGFYLEDGAIKRGFTQYTNRALSVRCVSDI